MAKRRKSETAFQYSKRLLAIRQENLKAEIARIQAEGYTVPKAVIEQAENLQAGIRSDRQARQRLSVMTVGRIRGTAYKEYVIARQRITAYTKAGREIAVEAPPITVKKGYGKGDLTVEDVAKEMLKGLRYHFRVHPTRDRADIVVKNLKDLQKLTGVKLLNPPIGASGRPLYSWSKAHMMKTLSEISVKKFAYALQKAEDFSEGSIQGMADAIYRTGHASHEGHKAMLKVAHALAKDTFKSRNTLDDDTVETIYDFFENSRLWKEFRRKGDRSQYTVGELKQFVNSTKIDYDVFDNIIEGQSKEFSTLSDVIARYNVDIAKKAEKEKAEKEKSK